MKHRIFLVIALAALPLCAKGEKLTLDEARKMAEFYYSALDSITAKPDRATAIEMKIEEYFKRNTSFPVPNDLHFVYGNGSKGENSTINAQTYISNLRHLAEKGDILLTHKIIQCDYLTGPPGRYIGPLYVEVQIMRELFRNGKKLDDVLDRMIIRRDNRYPVIRNNYGGMRSDINTLMATAYSLYRQKEYKAAYKLIQEAYKLDPLNKDVAYWMNSFLTTQLLNQAEMDDLYRQSEQLLELDHKNYDACLRLSWMTTHGLSGKWYPKKVRKHLIDFYRLTVPTDGLYKKGDPLYILNLLDSNFANKIAEKNLAYVNKVIEMLEESAPDAYEEIFECFAAFIHNRMPIINYRKGTVGFIDKKGEWAIMQQYIDAYPFFPDATTFVKTKNHKWLRIDTTGRILDTFDNIKRSRIGDDILFQKDGKWGLMDKNGRFIQDSKYDTIEVYPYPLDEAEAYVFSSNAKRSIVVNGNELFTCVADNFKIISRSFGNEYDQRCGCPSSTTDKKHIHILVNYDENRLYEIRKQYSFTMRYVPASALKKIGTYFKIEL